MAHHQQRLTEKQCELAKGYLDIVAPIPSTAKCKGKSSPYLEGKTLYLFRNTQAKLDLAFIKRTWAAQDKNKKSSSRRNSATDKTD